jgi:hypothetical protein
VSDVLRMRMTRAPQRLVNHKALDWPTHIDDQPQHAAKLSRRVGNKKSKAQGTFVERILELQPEDARQSAIGFLESSRFAGGGAPLLVPLRELDLWLLDRDNHAKPADVVTELERLAGGARIATVVATATWRRERQRVMDSLVAGIVAHGEPDILTELMRLLLLFGLVEALALAPSPVTTADEVEEFVRYWTVLILAVQTSSSCVTSGKSMRRARLHISRTSYPTRPRNAR